MYHRRRDRLARSMALAMLGLAVLVGAVGPDPRAIAVRALHAQDVEIDAIGYRLAVANAALCPAGGHAPGFSFHTLGQYAPDYRAAAAAMFGLGVQPAVLSVAPASPAERAGLREGDDILSVDGVSVAAGTIGRRADYAPTAAALALVRRGVADGVARVAIRRGTVTQTIEIRAARACASIFQVVTDGAMNGAADGTYVQISSDLVALAQSSDERAALLAHELAHNILRHRVRLDALSVDRGILAGLGRSGALIRATEIEADRLSVHLLAAAGYDPAKGAAVWQALAARRPQLLNTTHPGWRERERLMAIERARIAAGQGLPADLVAKIASTGQP